MANQTSPKKGFFSRVGLPLTRTYLYPSGRNRLLLPAAILAIAMSALLFADIWFQKSRLISNGPLSSDHAAFEDDCQSCHTGFQAVTDEKCSVCHEQYGGEVGVHSFDAHYVYRSHDLTRAFGRDGEQACFGCHTEHVGRETLITTVSDDNCLGCHDYDAFASGHPQFEFVQGAIADDSGLAFTHIRHVQIVRSEKTLNDIEEACLTCHQPRQDGRRFKPIDFDAHCGSCHLGFSQRVRSARFDLKDPARPVLIDRGDRVELNLGAETVQTVRARQGPGEQWALEASLADFRSRGGSVMRMRVRHLDPWISHHLKMARNALYPSSGLSELLKASPRLPGHEPGVLYKEALETLNQYLEGLRGRTEDAAMAREVVELERLLSKTERRIKDPSTPLDDSQFLAPDAPNPKLSPQQIEEIEEFIQAVTQPCQKCHSVDRATIARVQKDQRVLRRAEFNHRAHVLQRRCLDCHSAIPFAEAMAGLTVDDKPPPQDAEIDRAAIQNIPGIDECTVCHRPNLVRETCVTCHRFHPDSGNRARLLLHSKQGPR